MSARLDSLKEYLGMHAEMYSRNPREGYHHGIAGLLLEHGEAFCGPGEALAEEEAQAVADAAAFWSHGFAVKECFYNAQRLSVYSDRFLYWEGYAWGHAIIPVHHAWVTVGGKVVDLTWRIEPLSDASKAKEGGRMPVEHAYGPVLASFRDRFALGLMPEDAAFLGVQIDASACLQRMQERGACWSFLDDWESGYPLLRRDAWEAA